MLIIGERLNASLKYIALAISSRNAAFIQNEAKSQALSGADYLEVNTRAFEGEEIEHLSWLVETVQEVTDLSLCIDSLDPEVIRAVLPLVRKPPMINSITLEPSRLKAVLPLIKQSRAKVIGLCQSEDGIAKSVDDKVRLARKLVEAVTAEGIPLSDLYIDPLVRPILTDSESALNTLNGIRRIMEQFPGVHTTCGLRNISQGLPNRKLVNCSFLVEAIGCGLDSVIIDPTDKRLYGALRAGVMIAGKDKNCMDYIRAHRGGLMD